MGKVRGDRTKCWYCEVKLLAKLGQPRSRTREHLIAKANGGGGGRNLRWACAGCNVFVGDWGLEDKLKFRELVREIGGWGELRKAFAPGSERKWKVQCALAKRGEARGEEAEVARRQLRGPTQGRPEAGESSRPPPARVLVDATKYVDAGGVGPEDRYISPWRFQIGTEVYALKRSRPFWAARRRAVARAVKAGVEVVEVLPLG